MIDAGFVRFDGEPSSWLQRELAVMAIEHGDRARAEQVWLSVQDPRRLRRRAAERPRSLAVLVSLAEAIGSRGKVG